MALALQWSLDNTANSGLSLSRGLIAAATSDNVEPLAVAACEKFGATLSICRDSCAKVERLVEPRKPVVTFLGAYIGYSANDCATQLVKSVAGVQFLALVGPLVSSIGSHQAAEALEILLEQSAVDKTQVPPAGKLQPLLKALDPRCTPLRFLDSVIYCKNLLVQYSKSAKSKTFWKVANQLPDADGIAKLVLALAQLSQSGPRSRLELKAASTAPWVIAFTTLEISGGGLEISFSSDLGRPSDLIVCQVSNVGWSGMVSVKAYGQSLRDEFDMSSDNAIQCLTDTLPFAVYQCLKLLRPSKDYRRGFSGLANYSPLTFDESFISLSAIPFGQDANICKVISLMLGLPSEAPPICLKPFPDNVPFHNLPALQAYLAELKTTCKCVQCNRNESKSYEQCDPASFCRGIVALVTDILCLSFFENIRELTVSLHQAPGARMEVGSAVFALLVEGGPQPYHVLNFYDWALALVGYSELDRAQSGVARRIMSSVKGQVTYMKLFETRSVARRGYMTLAWARGQLRFEDVEYLAAVESKRLSIQGAAMRREEDVPVMCPRNLYPNYSMGWTAIPGGEGLLELSPLCRNPRFHVPVNPFNILENISHSLIMKGCKHDSDTPLNEPDVEAVYTGPLFCDNFLDPGDLTSTMCAAVAGDNGLRLLTFGSRDPPFPMVLRGDACLACALDVCRKAKSRLLIL